MQIWKVYGWQHLVAYALVALTIANAVVLMSTAWLFDTDDAFITLRYARHWVEGHGIVWNPGENPPIEGYSNITYLLLGALSLKVGLNPIQTLKLFSAASLLGTCVLLYVLTRRWLGPIGATIPALLFVNFRGTIHWTVSGLETAHYVLLAVAAVTVLVLALRYPAVGTGDDEAASPGAPLPPPSTPLLVLAGLLSSLAAIARPEGPLVFLVVAATASLHWARRRAVGRAAPTELRGLAALVAAFGVPYTAYFLWRVLYFERLLPNTVVCKGAYTGDPLQLTLEFLAVAWPFGLLSLIQRRLDVRNIALWGLAVLYSLVLIGADPIIGHFNRHFLAAFSLLIVLAAVGFVNLLSFVPRVTRTAAEVTALVVVGLIVSSQFSTLHNFFYKDSRYYAERQAMRRALGDVLNELLEEDESYVLGDAGLTPYVTRTRVIDAYCLNNRAFTEPPISFSTERFIDDLLENEKPEAIVLVSRRPDAFIPWGAYRFGATMAEDPRFQRDYRSVLKVPTKRDEFNSFVFLRADLAEERTAKLRAGK